MYMVSGHLDGRGGGDGFDDDGSAVALVLEAARVLAGSDVTTDKSVRFFFWDKEELGLYGRRYVRHTSRTGTSLQGTTAEPTWLGLIQHDMILYDHGAGTRTTAQSAYADLDVEWRAGTTKEADSKALALKWAFVEGPYAPDYPATAYNYSTNTDDTSFHPYVASISVRENRRSLTSGTNAEWINPYYHTTTDIESSYTRDDDADGKRDDIELGYNAVRTTLGLVAELAGAHIATSNTAPVANAQSVTTNEDTAKAITLTGSDADGDPLTYSVVTQPAHGTLSGTAPNLTYTPAANYNGADSFTFKVNDGTVDSAAATVSITVTRGQRRAGRERAVGDDDRGHREGHHPDRLRRGRQPADLQRGDAAGPRQPERDRAQPDLHPGGQLQRRGQLHLQGERRHGRLGAGHGEHHGDAGQRRAGGERADGDDERGHGGGHHPDRLGRGRQPADLQRGDAAGATAA